MPTLARPALFRTSILAMWMVLGMGLLRGQQLVDDFNRANNTTVGGVWTETETSAPNSISVSASALQAGSTTSGRDFAWFDASSLYATTLSTNTCLLTWAFNMRQTRADPSGFNAGNYGVAYILGGTSSNPTMGQGYAVVLGQTSATDALRLVRFTGGFDANTDLTDLISTGDYGTQYLAVRVTFDPATNTWSLYVDSSTTLPFIDPVSLATLAGTVVDGTHAALDLRYTGCLWNHATGGTDNATFDNVNIPSACVVTPPTVNFTSAGVTVMENVGVVQTFQVNILPASTSAESITITLTNGAGAVYGTDYTTNPNGSSGSFVLNIAANATSITFTATILNDAIAETPEAETVTFSITSISGGLTAGTQLTSVLTIVDDDSPPTVLARGDLAVVGLNANNSNGGCSTNTGEDLISFFCFKDIKPGTTLDMTDNGFSSCTANFWNDNEGFVRMTRTGPTIPAGTVITFKGVNLIGTGNVSAVAPDALWSCLAFNGPSSSAFALNNGGDQIIILQGGTWSDPAGNNNASYTGGQFLYGFSSNGLWTAGACNSSNSGLPVGSECFSMAPTSAADFAKFTGDIITAKTQRQWLIAIDDPANWSSGYGNCLAYNSAAPNWIAAPVLPIVPGGMVNGLWTGAKGNDWFDCRNWDDAEIPTASTDVVLNQVYAPNCAVTTSSVTASTTAFCKTLTIRSNGIAKTLHIDQGRSLTVSGLTTIERTTAGSACGLRVKNGSFTTQGLLLRGTALGTQEAFFSDTVGTNTVTIDGNLRIEAGGRLGLTGASTVGGTIRVNGDFVNLDSEARFEDANSTVLFGGSSGQGISTSGFEEQFNILRVNKPSGDLTLNNGVTIRSNLDLLSGRIEEVSSLLTLQATATATSASNASFVRGPVMKYGIADFTFPIGEGNVYRWAKLSAIAGSATDAFTAQYFNDSPIAAFTPHARDGSLHHISDCEYWTIARSNGSANARVTLSWITPTSCGVTMTSEMRVARWDGSNWQDRGGASISGTTASGNVSTTLVEPAFSPWALASSTSNNPLPIQLLSFTAEPDGPVVRLTWTTATEQDNVYFTVERSTDLDTFIPVAMQDGAGNSQSLLAYTDIDPAPLDGLSYYRLRQTDSDGTTTVGAWVPVWRALEGDGPSVRYTSDGPLLTQAEAGSMLDVLDPTGRIVRQARVTSEPGFPIPVEGLPSGVYVLRITSGAHVRGIRFAF